ncbi:MAG: hydantoinase/oxoprolinase family protein [Coriobacteriales bacterium]|nr:hydantoinase/oxoprolinase family protein [Coriobacteriales bacterium]
MSKHVCVDVGGTFTDAAVLDERGYIRIFKSPTTPGDWAQGILEALRIAAEHYQEDFADFLTDISVSCGGHLTHGSTIASNAIIEKKTGKVGVLCTQGFRDVLLFREGPNKGPFDIEIAYPEPFVPRYLTLPIEERINSEGGIEVPLNKEEVARAVESLRNFEVEAVCICFLWSTVNSSHEHQAAALVKELWPEVEVVVSSEVNPSDREYRRWVSAAMDASLRKLVSTYVTTLNERLQEFGFRGEIGLLNCAGGIMDASEIVQKPLYSLDSGPSMAPVAGKVYAEKELNDSNAVILDMGGTTFDVSCVIVGHVSVSREALIGAEIPGISRVSVHSIGAGGGSIAWVDNGGMIRVGPTSAGSLPGPACYNRGSELPTVTDANLVLGYLNPEFFNEGRMTLAPERAYGAIEEHIARKLGISTLEAAYAIWATVNANMITAIKDITIWQGVDPRNYTMIAGGGACGLHAIPLAEGLEMQRLLIPRSAGGLSAAGGVLSDTVWENSLRTLTSTRNFNIDAVNEALSSLKRMALDFFERNGIAKSNRQIEFYMEGHYPFQVWDLSIDITDLLNGRHLLDEESIPVLEETFHQEYERTFTIRTDSAVECVYWRVKAIGKNHAADLLDTAPSAIDPALVPVVPYCKRDVYFRCGGLHDPVHTPVYKGSDLICGHTIEGPAIIEEPTTTVVVLPEYSLRVTDIHGYLIEGLK